MNIRAKFLLYIFFLVFLCSSTSWATNITIWDENGYYGLNQGGEDQETEPGMVNSQKWDLEGFFLDGYSLTMIGGFDFVNGEVGNSIPFSSGDIFISTGSKPLFGADDSTASSNQTTSNYAITNSFGYNYVIDLEFSFIQDGGSYIVREIDSSSELLASYYYGYGPEDVSNQASDPWRYNSGAVGAPIASGNIDFNRDITGTGFEGDIHHSVTVDLSFLDPGTEFYAHFTEQCGNDNLMGHGSTPVPEPATILLLITGLFGMAGARRSFLN